MFQTAHEVIHEVFLRVAAGVDLGDGAELRVRAEDEVDDGGCPLELAGVAIASFEYVLDPSQTSPTSCPCRAG